MEKKITLKERIENLESGEILHIGSGSGFFFIGSKTKAKKDIPGISNRFIRTARNKLKALSRELEAMEEQGCPHVEIQLFGYKSKKADLLITQNTKEINSQLKTKYDVHLNDTRQSFKNTNRYVENFVPVMEREIIEEYPRLSEDGIVVIVKGGEAGAYWYKKEYDSKQVPQEEEGGNE